MNLKLEKYRMLDLAVVVHVYNSNSQENYKFKATLDN